MPTRSAGPRDGNGDPAVGRVNVSFWFFALAAACALAGQDVLGLMAGALLHEAGHLAAMSVCGGRIGQIEVGLMGAKILPRYQTIPSTARELFVLFAGPAAGLFAGLGAAGLGFWSFAKINWFLSAFNLLPLSGLDGGSILSLVLTARLGERGEQVAQGVGIFFSAVLTAFLLALFWVKCVAI